MTASELNYVAAKVEKRIPTWQNVGLSSGGKMILVESCLSSVPNYAMGVYALQEEVRQKMDTAWHGPDMKRKYHMAKWDLMATPKAAGGAGFTDTRVMNKCLLAKWIFKIERGDNTICCNLLRQKYLGENIFSYKKKSGSQFWKGLISIREEFSRGVKYILGNGRKIRFWLDTWSGGCGLNLVFPNLYAICNQQEWTIDRVMRNGNINLTFRRGFGSVEENEWGDLVELAERVNITQQLDSVSWSLERSRNFTTASLYKELTFPGIMNNRMLNIWKAALPLKIKIFLWQICNDKIQTAEQLRKRNWTGPVECKLCGKIEC
jgi:hypothetical protein